MIQAKIHNLASHSEVADQGGTQSTRWHPSQHHNPAGPQSTDIELTNCHTV